MAEPAPRRSSSPGSASPMTSSGCGPRTGWPTSGAENKPTDGTTGQCPFCRIPGLGDEEGLVVHRGELAYAVLNLYPYAPGHLMVCPYRHIADYTETTDAEAAELGRPHPAGDARGPLGLRRRRFQHRHEPGSHRRGRHRGAPAPARRPPLGGRPELHAHHRPHQDAARAAGGHPGTPGRRLDRAWQRCFFVVSCSIELVVSPEALARLSARFSLIDFPDFADLLCRGDLSLMRDPLVGSLSGSVSWTVRLGRAGRRAASLRPPCWTDSRPSGRASCWRPSSTCSSGSASALTPSPSSGPSASRPARWCSSPRG